MNLGTKGHKLISLALILTMVFTTGVPAFASTEGVADNQSTTSSVEASDGDSSNSQKQDEQNKSDSEATQESTTENNTENEAKSSNKNMIAAALEDNEDKETSTKAKLGSGITFQYCKSMDEHTSARNTSSIKYTLDFVDENGKKVPAPDGVKANDITFSGSGVKITASTFDSLTVPGYTFDDAYAYFYWEGDYKGTKNDVTEFKNFGQRSDRYPNYNSYIGFKSSTVYGNDYYKSFPNEKGYSAYNPTGTLVVVFKKASKSNPYKTNYISMNNTVSVNNDTESKQEGKTWVWKPVNKLTDYTKDYMEKNYSPGDDYEFQGWCTSKDYNGNGTGAVIDASYFDKYVDSDVNLYAKWTKKKLSYSINYYINGTTTKVADSVTDEGDSGDTVTGTLKNIDGYTPVDPETITKSITLSKDTTEINFYYYKNVKLTANSATKTYNGAEQSVSGYTTDAGDSVKFDVNIGAKGTDVGDYTADASSANGAVDKTEKYIVTETVNGTLTINARQITVVANNMKKAYGEADPTFSAEVVGIINGDTITYTVSRPRAGIDEDVGVYDRAIVPIGETEQGNYKVKYVSATFEITKATGMKVTGTDYKGVYDGKTYGAAASASIKAGTTIYYSLNGGEETTKVPTVTDVKDSCTVKVRATNPNYEDATTEYTLKVTKASIAVLETDEATWDGETHTLVLGQREDNNYGQVSGEKFILKGATIKGINVGSYTDITKSVDYELKVEKVNGVDSTANYDISINGKLTIKPVSPMDLVELDTSACGYDGVYDGATHGKAAVLKTSSEAIEEGTEVQYSTDNGDSWSSEYPTVKDFTNGAKTVKVRAINNNFASPLEGEDYTLNVTKRTLVVYAQDTMEADGTTKTIKINENNLINESVENEGLVEGETLTIDGATISGKKAGIYTAVSDYTWKVTRTVAGDDNLADSTKNYSLELSGKLTLTSQPDDLTPIDPSDNNNTNGNNGVGGNSGTKTGDNTPIGILLGLLGVAAVGGGFAVFGRKKEQK